MSRCGIFLGKITIFLTCVESARVIVTKCPYCALYFQAAAEYWLGLGVEGIKVSNLDTVFNSTEWSKLQAVVQTNLTKDNRKR